VVIVGGGLAGCSLAYYLAQHGIESVLLERGELNREASGTNAGSFHFQIALHQLTAMETDNIRDRLLTEVRLHAEAAEVWSTLERELDGPLEIHTTGGLMVAETAEELQLLRDKLLIEQEAGLDMQVLTGRELRDFAPYLADDLLGASYCAQEGHANPSLAAPLFALRAVGAGAVVRTHAEVTSVAVDQDGGTGRFTVTTTAGTIRSSRLVNAAGAWAAALATQLGLQPPIRAEGLHLNVTEPREHMLGPMVQHIGRRLTLKQSETGTFIIGGGWPARPEQPPRRFSNRWDSAAGNTAIAIRVVPALAGVRVVRTWTGVMPFTDDGAPVVGESAVVPGYFVCLATTGFTLMPLLARMLAEHLASGAPLPPSFSPDRRSSHPATTI
jgi:glycine/D-amino acid oxidase-like deaminating enzyme